MALLFKNAKTAPNSKKYFISIVLLLNECNLKD